MRGRPKAELILSDDEREQLQSWARRRKTSQALALRSRLVLECARGAENNAVAARLAVTPQTVWRWRNRLLTMRPGGLTDAPRPGKPGRTEGEQVEAVISRTLEASPKDAAHWRTRSMANEMGLSKSAISRI